MSQPSQEEQAVRGDVADEKDERMIGPENGRCLGRDAAQSHDHGGSGGGFRALLSDIHEGFVHHFSYLQIAPIIYAGEIRSAGER